MLKQLNFPLDLTDAFVFYRLDRENQNRHIHGLGLETFAFVLHYCYPKILVEQGNLDDLTTNNSMIWSYLLFLSYLCGHGHFHLRYRSAAADEPLLGEFKEAFGLLK